MSEEKSKKTAEPETAREQFHIHATSTSTPITTEYHGLSHQIEPVVKALRDMVDAINALDKTGQKIHDVLKPKP